MRGDFSAKPRLVFDEGAGPEGADVVLQHADFPFNADFGRLLRQVLEARRGGLCDVDFCLLAAKLDIGDGAGLQLVGFERLGVVCFEELESCLPWLRSAASACSHFG